MSKLRLSGATSGFEEIKTADIGDNNSYQVGSTVTDAQGNVRALDRTGITSTPYALPSNSSGKFFSLGSGSGTFTIDANNFDVGHIITIYNHQDTDATISWTNMTNGVYIAGNTTNQGTSGSVTLTGKGLVTIIAAASNRLVINGNVS